MKKILFITASYLAGNEGGIYASRTHINLFAELSKEMTLLYPYKKGKEPVGINEQKISMIPIEDHRSVIHKFFSLLIGNVHRFGYVIDPYIDSSKYDTVVFDSSVVSSKLIKRYINNGILAITIHHNYQIEYVKGDCNNLIMLPTLFWTWIFERQAVKYSFLNITLTQQDADLLAKHYCKFAKFEVLGVFEYQRSSPVKLKAEPHSHKYAITGGLQAKQTENSIIPWINNYYPLLKQVDPKAELIIAGRDPSKRLADIITSSKIKLVASPPNMMQILQDADYYICPTDRGGGLKLRIMDGLKCGLPVLTHKVSARGYEKMSNQGFLFSYDSYESFIKNLSTIKTNNFSRREIQGAYYKLFGFEIGVERLKEIMSIAK